MFADSIRILVDDTDLGISAPQLQVPAYEYRAARRGILSHEVLFAGSNHVRFGNMPYDIAIVDGRGSKAYLPTPISTDCLVERSTTSTINALNNW